MARPLRPRRHSTFFVLPFSFLSSDDRPYSSSFIHPPPQSSVLHQRCQIFNTHTHTTNSSHTHFCTLNSILQHFNSELFLPLPLVSWPSQVQVLFNSSVSPLPSAVIPPCILLSFCLNPLQLSPLSLSPRLFHPCFCLLQHCLVLLLTACSVNNTLITICEERSEFLSDWTNDWGREEDGARMWILWMRKQMCVCEGENE